MDALSAFLDWCQESGCSLAASGSPRDQLTQLIAGIDQGALPASYTTDGVTREATSRPACSRARSFRSSTAARTAGRPSATGQRSRQHRRRAQAAGERRPVPGRRPDGHYDSLVEANSIITCVDRPAKGTPTTARELADVAAFQAELPPWGGSFATAPCVGMPKPAKGDKLGDVQVRGTAPTLSSAPPVIRRRRTRARRVGRPDPGGRPPHVREHGAHRLRPRQPLHRRRGRRLPCRRRPAAPRHPLRPLAELGLLQGVN